MCPGTQHGVLEAGLGVLEAGLGVLEARLGVLEAGPGVLEAGLGGLEGHLGDYCVLLMVLGGSRTLWGRSRELQSANH